jgi:hypothetical protein
MEQVIIEKEEFKDLSVEETDNKLRSNFYYCSLINYIAALENKSVYAIIRTIAEYIVKENKDFCYNVQDKKW